MNDQLDSGHASCRIQKLVRAHFARKRVKRIRRTNYQRAYQLQFETQETLFRFKFQQNGAAIKIQRWYRSSFLECHKLRWRKKFIKVIEKCISQKILRRIIRRSKGFDFSKSYLLTTEGVIFGSTIVLQRISRGMLGRRYFARTKLQKEAELKYISKIQSTMRTTIARQKFPEVGTRYRMLKKKERDWTRRQSTHENLVITEKQLRTLQAAAQAAEAKAHHKQHVGLLSLTHTVAQSDVVVEEEGENSDTDSEDGGGKEDDGTFSYTRRASFLFVNMKLGPLELLESLDDRILKVQCAWYRYKAYRRVRRLKEQNRLRRVVQLQRWFSNVLWRRHVRKAARIIQPLWKERVRVIRLKRASATRIQAFWRGFVKHLWWRVLVTKRNFFGLKIKRFLRYKHRMRIIHIKVKRLRSLTELRVAGLYLYQQTEQHWLTHYLWLGIKKTKSYEVLHELQRLFTAYSLNGNLEALKFVKMMKECSGGLIVAGNSSTDMSLNTMELQFSRIKAQNEKRIDYAKFVDLLYNLAIIKFLKLDPSKVLVPSALDGKEGAKDSKAVDAPPVISGFRFNGLKGKAALVTRFFMTYIATMAEYPAVVAMLKQKAAKYLSTTHIAENLKTLQVFVLNRLAIGRLRKDMIRLVAIKREKRIQNVARQIQKAIRGFLGKRMIMRCAQTIYTKYIDGESEREYWFNLRTNRSFWTKPTLLGQFDCGMATRMPRPEEQYSIYCTICVDGTAQCYCLQCNEPQCLSCFATSHKGGQRKLHTNLQIDNCIQCEFQVGTRYCATCKDLFCDSCYKYMHRRGRLRYHVFERTSYCCEVCDDLTAQWKETKYPQVTVVDEVSASEKLLLLATGNEPEPIMQYGHFLTKLYCGRCYFTEHGVYPVPNEPHLVKVQFYGKTITAYRNQQAEDLRKKDIADKFARRTEELRIKKLNASVATIQRIARGFIKRREIAEFLRKRKEFMALRRSEEKDRHSLYYSMMTLLGFSPKLLSDTPLERVMKLYPYYMHHILSECVDNKWNEACRLLVEHEESLQRNPPSSILQRASARLSVAMTKRSLTAAEQSLQEKTHVYENLEQRYQQAESTGVLAPSKMKKLQTTLNKAGASMNKAMDKKDKQEEKCNAARSKLTDCIGPRGLQSLIEQRRKHGLSMPFRVTLRKNCRQALVTWVNSEYVPPEENEEQQLADLELGVGFEDDAQQARDELFKTPEYVLHPGKWKERLKLGDSVFIEGVKCRVVRPPPSIAKKKLAKFKPVATNGDDSSMGATSGGDDSQSQSQSTKKRKVGTGDNSTNGGDMSGTLGEDSLMDGEAGVSNGMQVEVREEYTEDHIQLDRPWLLEDCYNVEIFKLVPVVFYMQPVNFCRRMALRSYPAQKITAVAAIINYKLSRLYERIGNLFDEESSSYSYWHNQARLKMLARDDFLKQSYSIVQMSFDFTLRRRIAKALYAVFSVFKMIFNLSKAVYKLIDAGAKETPYEVFQRSLNKVDIAVVLDLEGNNVTTLGEFKMDITAPVEIMREYIRRNFAAQLNETVGDSFLFYRIDPVGGVKGQRLKKEDEFKTYSKDYALLRTDATTMMSAMTATLVRDPDRGRVMMEVVAPEAEEDDEELLKLLKH